MNKMMGVYIIANELGDCIKLGYGNPYDRLEKLQQSTPHHLELVYVFEFESKRVAYIFEQRAHRALVEAGIERLKGEWFSCSAGRAEEIVRAEIVSAWDDCGKNGAYLELVGACPLDSIFA
jgi:hypothetical protein